MLQYIVFIGAAIQCIGIGLYIREVLAGRNKPNKVTRLMRAIAPLIATGAAFYDGVQRAVLPVFMSGFGPLLVFISSFFTTKAYRKIEKSDYICGILSLTALVGWRITNEPLIAIILAILADAFAAIPTLIKSRTHPHTESSSAYLTGLISVITAFFAMQTYNLAEIAFPIYIIMLNTSLMILLHRKTRINAVKSS